MPGDRPNDLVDRAYQVGAFAVANPAAAATAAAVDRRRTILALGIIQIVLGGISALMALAGFIPAIKAGEAPAVALIPIVPAANLLLTGIGSVKIVRWARRATLVSAGAWLTFVIVAVIILAVASKGGFGMGRGELALIGVLMLPGLLVGLALPIVLLVVYTRPSVRATFERRAA